MTASDGNWDRIAPLWDDVLVHNSIKAPYVAYLTIADHASGGWMTWISGLARSNRLFKNSRRSSELVCLFEMLQECPGT